MRYNRTPVTSSINNDSGNKCAYVIRLSAKTLMSLGARWLKIIRHHSAKGLDLFSC